MTNIENVSSEDRSIGWHVGESQLRRYVEGGLGDIEAWSVETHLTACASCASRVREALNDRQLACRLRTGRQRVLSQARVEAEARARVGTRTSSPWSHAWRVLTATPASRLPWLTATIFVIASATALSVFVGGPAQSRPILLLVAPVLPLAGVALSYGPGMDPAYELTASTPYSGLRLLLLRTLAVLAVSIPLLVVASVVVPTSQFSAVAWVLPALALVLATLAIGSWAGHHVGAALIGTGWVLAVAVPRSVFAGGFSYLFIAPAQWVWAAVAVIALGLVFARHAAYDRMEEPAWSP